MIRIRRFVVVLSAITALNCVAKAAEAPVCAGADLAADPSIHPDYEAAAADLVNAEGVFWKIDKDGLPASYLFGTMHSTQPAAVALARKAGVHIEQSSVVLTELGGPFDAAARVDMGSTMIAAALSTDADSFAGELTGADAELVEQYLAKKGYAKDFAHRLKLWLLAVATALPECEVEGERQGLPEVDNTIAEIGRARGLAVVGLETIAEQTSAIAATPSKLAAQLLVAAAKSPDLDNDVYVTLLNLYLGGHPTRILPIVDAAPGLAEVYRAAERDFTKLLLVSRNEGMASHSAPYLDKGGAFIAVGALHLSGKDGLVERFRRMGFSVTRVW